MCAALRLYSSGQQQGDGIEGVNSAQIVALGNLLFGLALDQGVGDVSLRPTIGLRGASDRFVFLKVQICTLQQVIYQVDQIGPGRAIPAAGQRPNCFRQYHVHNEYALAAFNHATRTFSVPLVVSQEI